MNNKNHYKKHEELLKKWMLNAQKRWPNSRWQKRDIGFFKTLRDTPIKIGLKGQADICGFIPYGDKHCLWCEIEFKSGNAKQTKHQKNWETTVNNMRGIYVVVRDPEQFDEIEKELQDRQV